MLYNKKDYEYLEAAGVPFEGIEPLLDENDDIIDPTQHAQYNNQPEISLKYRIGQTLYSRKDKQYVVDSYDENTQLYGITQLNNPAYGVVQWTEEEIDNAFFIIPNTELSTTPSTAIQPQPEVFNEAFFDFSNWTFLIEYDNGSYHDTANFPNAVRFTNPIIGVIVMFDMNDNRLTVVLPEEIRRRLQLESSEEPIEEVPIFDEPRGKAGSSAWFDDWGTLLSEVAFYSSNAVALYYLMPHIGTAVAFTWRNFGIALAYFNSSYRNPQSGRVYNPNKLMKNIYAKRIIVY